MPMPDVFSALSDPSRRHLLESLAGRESASLSELAAELPVTRQAVSKHLAALGDAGLVHVSRAGRETRYRLTPEPLEDAVVWMARVGARWDKRLALRWWGDGEESEVTFTLVPIPAGTRLVVTETASCDWAWGIQMYADASRRGLLSAV